MQISYKHPHIIITYRDSSNHRVIEKVNVSDFPPYFYIPKSCEVPSDSRILRVEDTPKKSIFGEEVKKIVVREVWDVPRVKQLFYKHFEADIRFHDRYILDRIKEIPKENLRKCYFDLETEDFPSSTMDDKKITCVGWYDNYEDKYYSLVLSDKESVEERKGHIIFYFKTEEGVLNKFIDLVKEKDYDMLVAHNGARFDYPVFVGRIQKLSIMNYGRMSVTGVVKRDNYFGEWECTIGNRILFDFLGAKTIFGTKGGIRGLLEGKDIIVTENGEKKITRIKRWGLGYLAKFVGMEKGNIKNLKTEEDLIQYNKKDIEIMVVLDKKFNVSEYYHNMQMLIGCSFENTYFNTNMIDMFLLRRYSHMVFPTKPERDRGESKNKIRGATVDESIAGLYEILYDIDQTSLYPSTIVSYNLSPEVIREDGDIVVGNGIKTISSQKGMLADAVEFLLSIRLKYKQMAKEEKDDKKAQEYSLLSDGYKILLVSFYGGLLFKSFRLYDFKLAEAIPFAGREIKEHVRGLCEKYGYKIVRGHSVSKDSEVILKKGKNVFFDKIENLFKKTDYYHEDNEYFIPNDLYTLTIDNEGKSKWNRINHIVRHMNDGKFFNISVNNKWKVEVTGDHSLIGYPNVIEIKKLNNKFVEVKPEEIGNKLSSLVSIKYIPREKIESKNYPKELYEFMGFFIGDGSFEFKNKNKIYDILISSGNDTFEIIDKVIEPLYRMGYIDHYYIRRRGFDFRVRGKITEIMEDFRDGITKIIPKWLEYETKENINSFIRGIYESDGSISKRGSTYTITFTNIREDIIKKVQELMWYSGIPSSICKENNTNKYKGKDSGTCTLRLNIRDDFNFKENVGFITDRKKEKLSHVVIGSRKGRIVNEEFDVVNHLKILEKPYNDYVYDLEVEETHNFFANGILVHNTDASFLVPPAEKSVSIEELVEIINKSFDEFALKRGIKKHNLHIELDKIYSPAILSDARTRYVGYQIKKGERIFKITGFEAVRADSPPITDKLQEDIFKIILNGGKRVDVEKYVETLKADIKNGKFSIVDVALPKGFSKKLDKYKTITPWVRGLEYSNKHLGTKYDEHSDVAIVYVKGIPDGKVGTDVVSITKDDEEILNGFVVDWDKMFEKAIDMKVERIYEIMSWGDTRQKSLLDFGG